MSARPFAHVTGRRAWERCGVDGALSGLLIDGQSGALRLLTDQEDADLGTLDEARWEAWRARRGGAIWRPLGPERCAEREVLLGGNQGALAWDGRRWGPVEGLPTTALVGLEADVDGVLWALSSAGPTSNFLRFTSLGYSPLAPVEAPAGLLQFTLCADGLIGIDAARVWWRRAERWEAVGLPLELDNLVPVAITRWGDGAALLFRGQGRCALAVLRRGRVEAALLPELDTALGLVSLPDGDLLVGELVAVDSKRERMRFGRYRRISERANITWSRVEAWQVVGFDGRALFTDSDGQPWATTPRGPRRLYRSADTYVGAPVPERADGVKGEVTTWALDAGTPATPWHRVFIDVELPEGTELRLYARTFDRESEELPEWSIRLDHLDRRPGWSDRPFPPLERPPFDTLEGLLPTWPGRFLRLRIELIGTRRASPTLHGIRATLPRPSLLDWLPATWRQDTDTKPNFKSPNMTGWGRLERLLALFEGPLTELEARADALPTLWDPSATPADVLPWLAGLIGWTLDTRLGDAGRRRLLIEAASLHRQRGTVPGIRRLCSILADCEVQVVESFRHRRQLGAVLGREAAGPHDTPGAVLGPGMTLAEGESGDPGEWYGTYAHRFSVNLYRDPDPDLAAMVQRAVEEYRPAHTEFEIRWLGSGLRLGSGSFVGLGTVPGPSEQQIGVEALILGAEGTPLGGRLDAGPTVLPHPSSLYASFPAPRPAKDRSSP